MHQKESSKLNKKLQGNRKRNTMKIILSAVLILLLVGAVFFVAHNAGYIPIFLDIKRPIGKSVELDNGRCIEEFPELGEIPNLDKIEYAAFGTDKSIDVVVNDYKERLRKERYSLEYEGNGYLNGSYFQYYGFLKGITAVGIVVPSDVNENLGYETVVLYTTGSALDFKEILNWYQEK